MTQDGATVTSDEPGLLQVEGAEAPGIGELAAASGVVLHELTPETSTLEEAYMRLTADAVEYRTEPATAAADPDDTVRPTALEGARR